MKKYLLIILLLFSFILTAQSKKKCDSILAEKINTSFNDSVNLEQFRTNLIKLNGCGVDLLDIEIFSSGPIAASFLMDIVSKKDKDSVLTYNLFFNKVLEFKETENYQKIKKITRISKILETKPATIKNWDEDKLLLEELEMPEQYILNFHTYLKNNANISQTYKDALISFSDIIKTENTVLIDDFQEFFKNKGPVDFNNLLKTSKENQKPILLYFTGYACVNCKKMEENIFRIKPIFDILKDKFLFTSLYVDDRKKLPETDWIKSEVNGKIIKTVGRKNSEFQITKFNTNMQPFFAILNSDGLLLEKFTYTNIENDFIDFLTRGLNKK